MGEEAQHPQKVLGTPTQGWGCGRVTGDPAAPLGLLMANEGREGAALTPGWR